MRAALIGLSISIVALLANVPAYGQDAEQQQQLPQLDRGEKLEKIALPAVLEKLTGWTKFGKGKVYMLPLKKGQHVRITFSSKSKYAYMAIFDLSSSEDESFFGTDEDGNTADVTVNEDTTWLIKPYYSRVTRRRGLGAPYEILIDPNPPATQQPPDQQKDKGPMLFPPRAKQGQ
ncbi:hypothetical protein [Rhizobium sp. SYY.PMSO]|uniref:hypothetical protein n=1 Tax=Rhizobium sp. SYY.PMSO TaxID=3382192 RepID=UPI00398F9B6F